MKKEGNGDPQRPDISFGADVKIKELHFEKTPRPEVYFVGNTGRDSVWKSRRDNLPDSAQEGVAYRDARVRLLIATETTGGPERPGASETKNKEKKEKK